MSKSGSRPISSRTSGGVRPFFDRGGITLYHGDSLELLPRLERGVADALITDPPYSSGGTTSAERARDPVEKYCQNSNAVGRPSFAGDMRDQRSFAFWGALWGVLARRGVACALTGRRFIGIEQSEEYCRIAKERFEAALAGRGRKAA